jgi:hypothetical protein
MPPVSFRLIASRLVPPGNPRKQAVLGLAVLCAAGCGGTPGPKERPVRAAGYSFSAPVGWTVVHKAREVSASKGLALVSVERFPLLRPYRPELWDKVVPELDAAADAIARQQSGTVGDPTTVAVAGSRARRYDVAYEHEGKQLVERLAFLLRGKTEYLLLCRYERGGDTRACDRLLATFRLT